MATAANVGLSQYLIHQFAARTQPIPTSSTNSGIEHEGNWPLSASYAVEYECFDRQFPQVKHERRAQYFDDLPALLAWVKQQKEWVVGTDYDFSVQYTIYKWDLGPERCSTHWI